jgi:uncharacterized protein (DUF885 family)
MLRTPLALVLCLAACGSGAAPPAQVPNADAPGQPAAARWDALVDGFIEHSLADRPSFAVALGRHEYDGKVADVSRPAIEARIARLEQSRSEADAIAPSSLDARRSFERDYLLAQIDGDLFWARRYRDWERDPRFYADIIDPSVYLTREYAPLAQRMAAYTAHLREVPRVLAAVKENVKTPLPRTYVETAQSVYGGLAPYLENDVLAIFASVHDPAAQAALREATAGAVRAVNDVNAWLAAQKAQATEAFALGSEVFSEMLWATERVDVPLARLEEVGRQDLEQNLAALTVACSKAAPGKSLQQCATLVNDDKPAAGPVAGAREQLTSLRRFLEDAQIVSIPGPEEARVEEAPPYKRWNQAYIDIPGPYEKNMPSIYYIAPPDPTWSAADRQAYIPGAADLLFISVHEVWPGHFLQYLHANRADRMFGRIFVGYAFAEGWAHYSEQLMWDAGLSSGDAKVHVGQLLNALLRNVRFVSAIGLHTQGMSVAESEALFRDKALQDPGNARQQAARGTFDPGYLNYTLGKLMIRKLRDDYAATRGGKAAWREFHDRLLSYGGPPLPLVRKAMLGDGSAPL